MPVSYLIGIALGSLYLALVPGCPRSLAHTYMVVPVGAIVGGIGATTVLLTLLTLSLHAWHRKRVHAAAPQRHVDQFDMSAPIPSPLHFHPSSITASSFSVPTAASEAGQSHFQQALPVIRKLNGTPSRFSSPGKGSTIVLEPTTVPSPPPPYYAG